MIELHYLPKSTYPMTSILDAIDSAIPNMVSGKRYELSQIVELGAPGLWDRFTNYKKKCIGYTVAGMVTNHEITGLRFYDPDKRPIKYIIV